MAQITVNTTDYAIRCAREDLVGWAGALDAKRPAAWRQFGYPDAVTFLHLRAAYERGGPGFGAVHRLLDRCWLANPRIKRPDQDAETPWEQNVKAIFKQLGLWRKLRDLDRRNLVGRFAGLIYRAADGKALREPLDRAQSLVDAIPVYEDQLRVTAWNSNPEADNFGTPAMWQYRMRTFSNVDTQGHPDRWQEVHPSRIQIMAEGAVHDFMDGVPLLRAGFNHLVDLEKIGGGSAESFLKNSARTVVLKFDADASPQALTQNPDGSDSTKTVAQVVEEKVTALNRSIDSSIVIQGGEASTLQTQIANPEPSFHVAANLFSASVQIPMTVLFGVMTGRLASDQDQKDFDARCAARQANELTPMIEEFVRRMQAVGTIESGDFEVEWGEQGSAGLPEKTAQLTAMTAAMKAAYDAGEVQQLFTPNELRRVLGYEELPEPEMPAEGTPPAAGNPAPEDGTQVAGDA